MCKKVLKAVSVVLVMSFMAATSFSGWFFSDAGIFCLGGSEVLAAAAPPPISPTYKQVWNFNTAGNSEGWTAGSQVTGAGVSGGYYTATSTGTDPYICSADNLNIDITNCPYVKIRLKNTTSNNYGKIYFLTGTDTTWTEAKALAFTVDPNNSSFQDYVVDLWSNQNWTGTLKRLRVDPFTATGQFSIDYIGILDNSSLQLGTNYITDPGFDGNTMQAGGTGSTLSLCTTEFHGGNQSLKVTKTAAYGQVNFAPPLQNKSKYYFSVWAKMPSGSTSKPVLRFVVQYRLDGVVKQKMVTSSVSLSSTRWNQVGGFITIDETGIVSVPGIFMYTDVPDALESFLIDDIAVMPYAMAMNKFNDALSVNETENLTIKVDPAANYDTTDGNSIIWSSSNTSVAKLTGSSAIRRAVTALSAGTSTITATTRDGKMQTSCEVTVTAAVQPQNTTAAFTMGTGSSIPAEIFGVHHPVLTSLGSTSTYYSKSVSTMLTDLGYKSVRGPDGTAANYYLFRDGSLVNARDPRYSNRTTGFEYTWPGWVKNGGNPGLYLADIYKYPEEVGIPYIFVVNVGFQTPSDVVAQLTQIKTLTQRPIRIELGNEIYMSTELPEFPTVNDYITKCRAISQAVRTYDSSIKMGAVIVGTLTARYSYWKQWNTAIAQNSDFYDAIITHEYTPFDTVNDLTVTKLMQYLYARDVQEVADIKSMAQTYSGKEIWVTEFGAMSSYIFNEPDLNERARIIFSKTPGFAMHYMERTLGYIKAGGVKAATYHNLLDSQFFGVLQTKYVDPNTTGGGYVPLPTYYTTRELGRLLKNNSYYYDINRTSGTTTTINDMWPPSLEIGKNVAVSDVGAWGIGDQTGVNYILFSNRTNNNTTVSVDSQSMIPMWSYGGSDPIPNFSLNNYSVSWKQEPNNILLPEVNEQDFATSVTLKPYSMTVVGLKKKTFSDVGSSYWAKSYIENLASKDIVPYNVTTNYLPDQGITRAEFVKMMADALRISYDYAKTPKTFNDVASTAWYYNVVTAAARYGIFQADGSGNFNPNQVIVGQDVKTMLETAATAVKNMNIQGQISIGTGNVTRATAAQYIYQFIQLVK